MTVELVNPPGIPAPEQYRQVAVTTGTRTIYVSGQVARDAEGSPVGAGDLTAQTEQAFRNVVTALTGVGAGTADIAKLTVYVVDWTPDKMAAFGAGLAAAADLGGRAGAVTLVGVTALSEPDLLVEIEAVAVL